MLGDDGFQVGADPVSQIGDLGRRGGIVAPGGAADEVGPAPMAKSSSVVAGISETMRRAGSARRTVSPASSTTWMRPAEAWGEAQATSTAAARPWIAGC